MAKNKPEKGDAEVKLIRGGQQTAKRADDFVSLYVNNVQFGYTRFDFQIMLGRVEISRDENHNHVKETAVLTMTPEYAKAFLNDFSRVLADYEKQHGELKIRPDISESLKESTPEKPNIKTEF
jgi:hypothetical protein